MAQAAATTATIPALLRQLTQAPAAEAWPAAVAHARAICRAPLTPARAVGEVVRRERELGALDNLLAGSAWDLWQELPDCVETTTERLVRWWAQTHGGKAALVLDGFRVAAHLLALHAHRAGRSIGSGGGLAGLQLQQHVKRAVRT
jgi:hypothetical protein